MLTYLLWGAAFSLGTLILGSLVGRRLRALSEPPSVELTPERLYLLVEAERRQRQAGGYEELA